MYDYTTAPGVNLATGFDGEKYSKKKRLAKNMASPQPTIPTHVLSCLSFFRAYRPQVFPYPLTYMRLLRTSRISIPSQAYLGSSSAHPHLARIPYTLRHHTIMATASRLKGKTVLITGASSGIGRSVAFEFARTQPNDLKLILTARRIDKLEEVAAQIRELAKGVKVLAVKLDVRKREEIDAFVGQLPQEFQDVHVLVNNA